MENKIKNWFSHNWFRFLIMVFIIVFVIGGCFYWYEYRPSRIRHDCSWIKKHADAKQEIIISQSQFEECVASQDDKRKKEFEECRGRDNLFCRFLDSICPQSRPAVPAKDWWEKASKEEYEFCIHEKGL